MNNLYVIEQIIELELELLKKQRIPSIVFMNKATFDTLIRELEKDKFFNVIHGMKIEIVSTKGALVVV